MITSLKIWFINLSKREQILIAILAILSTVIGGYYLIFSPINAMIEDAQSKHDQAVMNYGAIISKTNLLKKKPNEDTVQVVNGLLALDAYISQSAAENSIPLEKNSLQNDSTVQINITKIRAQPLFAWLHNMDRQGISTQSLSITKNDNGIVSAEIILSKATIS